MAGQSSTAGYQADLGGMGGAVTNFGQTGQQLGQLAERLDRTDLPTSAMGPIGAGVSSAMRTAKGQLVRAMDSWLGAFSGTTDSVGDAAEGYGAGDQQVAQSFAGTGPSSGSAASTPSNTSSSGGAGGGGTGPSDSAARAAGTGPSTGPIAIDGDVDFRAPGHGVRNPGAAGTAADPYLIEGHVTGNPLLPTETGIQVSNTTRNFKIVDSDVSFAHTGVRLTNVANAAIDGLKVSAISGGFSSGYHQPGGNAYGIYLDSARNVAINHADVGGVVGGPGWVGGIVNGATGNNGGAAYGIYTTGHNSDLTISDLQIHGVVGGPGAAGVVTMQPGGAGGGGGTGGTATAMEFADVHGLTVSGTAVSGVWGGSGGAGAVGTLGGLAGNGGAGGGGGAGGPAAGLHAVDSSEVSVRGDSFGMLFGGAGGAGGAGAIPGLAGGTGGAGGVAGAGGNVEAIHADGVHGINVTGTTATGAWGGAGGAGGAGAMASVIGAGGPGGAAGNGGHADAVHIAHSNGDVRSNALGVVFGGAGGAGGAGAVGGLAGGTGGHGGNGGSAVGIRASGDSHLGTADNDIRYVYGAAGGRGALGGAEILGWAHGGNGGDGGHGIGVFRPAGAVGAGDTIGDVHAGPGARGGQMGGARGTDGLQGPVVEVGPGREPVPPAR